MKQKTISRTEEWTKKLKPRFEYNMTYSNMDNSTALKIVYAIVEDVLAEIENEEQYTSTEAMIERALDKYRKIMEARES